MKVLVLFFIGGPLLLDLLILPIAFTLKLIRQIHEAAKKQANEEVPFQTPQQAHDSPLINQRKSIAEPTEDPDSWSLANPQALQKPKPTRTFEANITQIQGECWVIDGDGLRIQDIDIRLFGIDAPEWDHPYGRNAKFFLIKLTRGQTIKAYFHCQQSHGREVATCYLPDGRDLSAEMVKAGLAIDWPKFSGGKYRHLEPPDARKRMWRADARQKGNWPPQGEV